MTVLALLKDDIIRKEFENLKDKGEGRPFDLYLRYKSLSVGVFDEYVGKYGKSELCVMRDRNLTCAKLRMKYTRMFVEPEYRDEGHTQIVCAAIVKAIACHIASQPTNVLRAWYTDMRVVHQAGVDYTKRGNSKCSFEECRNAVTKEIIWYRPHVRDAVRRLPVFLLDRVVDFSLDNPTYVLVETFSPKMFWNMTGFNLDPLTKLMWPSL